MGTTFRLGRTSRPRNAPRARARYRPPTCRRSLFMAGCSPNHLEEDGLRADGYAVVVSLIRLADASSSGRRSDVSRKLYLVPLRGWVSTGLPPPCWSSQIAFRWPFRPYDGLTKPPSTSRLAAATSKTERTSVGRVVRDLIRGFHRTHFGYQQERGRSFVRVPSLGQAQLTPPRSIRNGIRVNRQNHCGDLVGLLAGVCGCDDGKFG